jgi:hypothetical protein
MLQIYSRATKTNKQHNMIGDLTDGQILVQADQERHGAERLFYLWI